MDSSTVVVPPAELPDLPAKHTDFVSYIASHPKVPIPELLQPYRTYDSRLREIYAQNPEFEALQDPYLNVVPVFAGQEKDIKTRARDVSNESADEKDKYVFPLADEDRRPHGSPAVVGSFRDFQSNFNVFSEGSLADMDWSNVVVAGSAAVTPLMPVPEKHRASKRALRNYYHEILAPASDVDLFLYGLTEEQAIEKIKQIESKIRDAILQETTTVRTKHAITIASQYPTRHVQIVLRVYKSVSEILTGFDVDCACAAYDGKQVYASPRALAAYMTQINPIDLSRRSPSYENRLSKYARRGFEVYWPLLDRSRVDPTIFERNFPRTLGLARLLVLEKLPKSTDRDSYLDQRRRERGRPAVNRFARAARQLRGNIKNNYEDEIAEWVDRDEVASYHTFSVPYGEKFHAKKIEKLLYTKDLLLNAEWNRPKDREVNLHRHPAFFGHVEDIIEDCCGYCPEPATPEEEERAEEEDKTYVKGKISFIKDDPGRQQIGSFNPLTEDDWTEMAYVGNTARLCQAIVDKDLEHVQDWLSQEGADPNRRDYTGRTPLHLATMCSSPEIVKALIDHGARIVARLADGKTALHIAAARGEVEMVKTIMDKSEENEELEMEKEDAKRKARLAAKQAAGDDSPEDDKVAEVKKAAKVEKEVEDEEDEEDDANDDEEDDDDEYSDVDDEDSETAELMSMATGSFVNVKDKKDEGMADMPEDPESEPDFYDVNVLAWDAKCSPLHLAIVNGHVDVVKVLVQNYGADVMLPIKLIDEYSREPSGAILTLALGLALPKEKAVEMTEALLELGASPAQADLHQKTAVYYTVATGAHLLDTIIKNDEPAFKRAVNHVSFGSDRWTPRALGLLGAAIDNRDVITTLKLLENGATPQITFDAWSKGIKIFAENSSYNRSRFDRSFYELYTTQPLIAALETEQPEVAIELLKAGADPNTLTTTGARVAQPNSSAWNWQRGETVLDVVQARIKGLKEWQSMADDKYKWNVKPLKDDAEYLNAYKEGSYQRWLAERQLEEEKERRKPLEKAHKKLVESEKEVKGSKLKKEAVNDLIKGLEELERVLIEKGARKFYDLHPDIKAPAERANFYSGNQKDEKEFEIQFTFNDDVSAHPDDKQAGFVKLFEAVWVGDLETIKSLTLSTWGEDNDQSPLKIAAYDTLDHTPFQLAVLRGHLQTAAGILEISQAQFYKNKPKEHYRLKTSNDSEYSDGEGEEDDEFKVFGTVTDATFTIENIGEVSTQVKSRTSPVQLISRQGGALARQLAKEALGKEAYENDYCSYTSLLGYAVFVDDLKLFKWLLELAQQYQRIHAAHSDDDNPQTTFYVPNDTFEAALSKGRIDFLDLILRKTGHGLPLDELVKKSGAEVKEKPKYYQGLSVHGKKRMDWAARSRGIAYSNTIATRPPPLLVAAKNGNIDSVEWFMGDAPLKVYKKFTEANAEDVKIKTLVTMRGGIDKTLSTFLGARSDLTLHCVVMSQPKEDTPELIKYILEEMPQTLDARSQEGWTPLMLAFALHRHTAVKVLIGAGANQTLRDKPGRNIAHHLLRAAHTITHQAMDQRIKKDSYRELMKLIDPRLRSTLFVERTTVDPGALTPLSYLMSLYVGRHRYGRPAGCDEQISKIVQAVLEFSGGEELEMINGAGDSPLHAAVLNTMPATTRVLLEFRPALLFRENAVGRTPLEVAEDAALIRKTMRTIPLRRDDYGTLQRPMKKPVLDMNEVQYYEAEHPRSKGHDCSVKPHDAAEKLLATVREAAAGAAATTRKLVTLYEANEVAKRLAAKSGEKSKEARRRAQEASVDDDEEKVQEEKPTDEVETWLPGAFAHVEVAWRKKRGPDGEFSDESEEEMRYTDEYDSDDSDYYSDEDEY